MQSAPQLFRVGDRVKVVQSPICWHGKPAYSPIPVGWEGTITEIRNDGFKMDYNDNIYHLNSLTDMYLEITEPPTTCPTGLTGTTSYKRPSKFQMGLEKFKQTINNANSNSQETKLEGRRRS